MNVTALRLAAKAADLASLPLDLAPVALPPLRPDEVLVEVHAAGVNPSDVKAALGLMPYAVFPRTPGRDFAGTVLAGPPSRSEDGCSAPPATSASGGTARMRPT